MVSEDKLLSAVHSEARHVRRGLRTLCNQEVRFGMYVQFRYDTDVTCRDCVAGVVQEELDDRGPFQVAQGRDLDRLASLIGVVRQTNETDAELRARAREEMSR